MKILKEVLIAVAALLGCVTGLWSACTTRDALKFKQPFEEHDQLVKSFMGQITSGQNRNDPNEVVRVGRNYEAFEENFRAGRQIAKIVAPIESLATDQVSAEDAAALREFRAKGAFVASPSVVSATTLGAAYLALNDFKDSAEQLDIATSKKKEPNAFALKAAAYSGLASGTDDPNLRQKYEAIAVASFNSALKASPKSTELTDFALAVPSLKAILEKKGIKLTNH